MTDISLPPVVKNALVEALAKGSMSADHARLIASVSAEFAKSAGKEEAPEHSQQAQKMEAFQ